MSGGSCLNCDGGSEWRAIKRINHKKCAMCAYETDPCHYLCVECQDGANWIPKNTLKKILMERIKTHKREIKRLKHLVKELNH